MKKLLTLLLLLGSLIDTSAQWNQCQTLTGGSIVTDFIKFNGKMYIAVDKSGLFSSADEGDSWQKLNVPMQGNLIHFVEHNSELLALSYATLFRTSDGAIWSQEDAPSAFINDVSSDGTTLFAATTSGIYTSTNAGADWGLVPDAATQISMSSIAVVGATVWAAADSPNGGVLFRSDNTGSSWTKVTKGTFKFNEIFIHGADVYVNAPFDGLYKSSNNGTSWQTLRTSTGESLFKGTASALYYFSNYQVTVSGDFGINWSVNTHATPTFSSQSIYPSDNHFFVGFWGGGVYRINAAGTGTWSAANTGLAITEVEDIEVAGNTIFVGTDFSFIHSSHNEGLTWDQLLDGYQYPGGARSIQAFGNDLYVGQGGGGIHRSANNGTSWELKSEGLTSKGIVGLTASSTAVFAGTSDGVFRTTNRGENWIKKSTGIPNSIRGLYYDGTAVYVGTFDGLFRSENEGESYTRISTGLPDESVACIARIGSTLFAATQFHGLYKTTNLGGLWEPVLNDFVLAMAAHKGRLFVGTLSSKLYVSHDLGGIWTDISIGLPTAQVSAINFTNENAIVGTSFGMGLWLRKASEILPATFTFYSNHAGMVFRLGESIFVKSDQELRTTTGTAVESADLSNYISIKDSHNQPATYTATIATDKKIITILLDHPATGETYTVTLSPFKSISGLTSVLTVSDPFEAVDNLPPVISNVSVSVPENQSIVFVASSFTTTFSDEDSDPLVKIKITTLPLHGSLTLNGSAVAANAEIPAASLGQLSYAPEKNYSGSDQIGWNASDGKVYALHAATVTITIDPITGIHAATTERVRIYPNPVTDILHIDFPSPENGGAVSVYDLSGRQIPTHGRRDESTGSTDVDLSALSGGLYILKIEQSGKLSQFRVVKKER